MNPFDFTAEQFLVTYLLVLAVGVLAAVALRWLMRTPGGQPPANLDDVLSPYEIAYLAGDELAATNAAIVRLLRHDGLRIASSGSRLERGERALPQDAHPLEQMIVGAVKNGSAEIDHVCAAGSPAAEKLRGRLVEMGLVVLREHANRICLMSAAVMLAVMFFGLTKFFLGISHDKPVGFLVMLLLFTAFATAAFFLVRPFRSRQGDVCASISHAGQCRPERYRSPTCNRAYRSRLDYRSGPVRHRHSRHGFVRSHARRPAQGADAWPVRGEHVVGRLR